MADGTTGLTLLDLEALTPAEEHVDEYVSRQPIPLDLWREYEAAANAGAFDECEERVEAEPETSHFEFIRTGGAR